MEEKQTPLFRRDFTLVVIGQIISLFGNAILRFALPLYLLRQTESPALFGAGGAAAFIPAVLCANTGKNIPEEDLDRIWIKFYKVDKARTREYGGSGIGLSIVKAIMDSFHRDCGVINHENGVEFWMELDTKNN